MAEDARPPNVVLVVVDALRADHVSCYPNGPDCTPEIGAFADQATVFERAISPAPWTLPSVTSLLTGLDAHEHGATSRGFRPNQGLALQRALAGVGYETVHVSPTTWIGDWLPQGRGFDRVREFTGPEHRRFAQGADVRELSEGVARGWRWYTQVLSRALRHEAPVQSLANVAAFLAGEWTEDSWLDDADASRRAARTACDEASRLAEQQPFFLLVHLMDPHLPFYVPERHRTDIHPPGCTDWDDEVAWMQELMDDIWRVRNGERTLDEAELAFLQARYRGEVRVADEAVGQILRGLQRRGLARDTLVAVTADHGEHLGEQVAGRTMLDHQASVRLPVLQVPLIVDPPGDRAAERRLELVQPHDLAHTIRAHAGLEHDRRRRLDEAPDPEERVALATYAGVVPSHPPEDERSAFLARSRASVILGDWKVDVHAQTPEELAIDALGDADRAVHVDWANGETSEASVAAIPEDVQARLARRLAGIQTPDPTPSGAIEAPGAGVERRLRRLGYLD